MATTTPSLSEFMPYGAPELQGVARPYMARALLVSSVFCTLALALAGATLMMFARQLPGVPRSFEVRLERIPAPPPLARVETPPPVAPAKPAHVAAGVAVPVPDEKAPPTTIAAQDELRTADPGLETGDDRGQLVITDPLDSLPVFGHYRYVEVTPEPVTRVKPDYPGIAKDAGVEGLVVAHALVGKDGHVLDVRLDEKRNVPMLNDAALAALRQWVFTPAFVNQHPVAVWVAVPFNFTLH
ncbi:MAG: energy transducer TonB [Candidatus Eisenbacteria bacterium]|nr:energy transducer TonB [Candidatus Eisenbacteria bacterium]